MADAHEQSSEVHPLLQQALSHPIRTATLDYLRHKEGEATDEAEVAKTLALPTPVVRYHLTVLRDAGLVRCVETEAGGRYIAASAA